MICAQVGASLYYARPLIKHRVNPTQPNEKTPQFRENAGTLIYGVRPHQTIKPLITKFHGRDVLHPYPYDNTLCNLHNLDAIIKIFSVLREVGLGQ